MYTWLLAYEIRLYLGRTFTSMPSGIVEVQNRSLGGHFPKSTFALCKVWINNCTFFSILTDFFNNACPTPIGTRHEMIALVREGMQESDIAGCVGLTRATVNCILQRHVATGTLVPGKSMGAPRKTTPRQDRTLFSMVRQDRFISAWALTA